MNSYKISVFLILKFIVFTVKAQDTLSLEQAIKIGLENNYSIKIAENNSEIAKNNHSLGNAGLLPILTANGSTSRTVENTHIELITGQVRDGEGAKSRNLNGSLNLGWTLFDGMGMFITHDKLNELEKMGETNLKLQIEDVVSNINRVYHQIVREQERLNVIKNILELSSERLEIAFTKYELGRVSRVEFLAAQVDYNTDTSSYILQLENLKNIKIDLNVLLGVDKSTDYYVQSKIYFIESLDREDLYQRMLSGNSTKKLYLLDSRVAHLEAREIKAERLPEINFIGSFNHNEFNAEVGQLTQRQADGFTFGLNANLNIFDGFNLNRRIQNAKINMINSELALQELDLQLKSQFDKAFNNYRNSLILYNLEQRNVEVARENTEIALERYKVGNTTAIELREAQLNLAQAENRLVDAAYSVKSSEIELLQLAGSQHDYIK